MTTTFHNKDPENADELAHLFIEHTNDNKALDADIQIIGMAWDVIRTIDVSNDEIIWYGRLWLRVNQEPIPPFTYEELVEPFFTISSFKGRDYYLGPWRYVADKNVSAMEFFFTEHDWPALEQNYKVKDALNIIAGKKSDPIRERFIWTNPETKRKDSLTHATGV